MKKVEFLEELCDIMQFNSTITNEGKLLSIQDAHDK